MFIMMAALYLLYELGGILLRFFPASRVAGGSRAERDAADRAEREPSGAGDA